MRIEEMKEEIRRYEWYLGGLTLGTSRTMVTRALFRADREIKKVKEGVDYEHRLAVLKQDQQRVQELDKLIARTEKMLEGYRKLAESLGVQFNDQAMPGGIHEGRSNISQ